MARWGDLQNNCYRIMRNEGQWHGIILLPLFCFLHQVGGWVIGAGDLELGGLRHGAMGGRFTK
jgi:hypothetical protein